MATELAVRHTVARISRTVAIRAWVRTSRVMGSRLNDIANLAPAQNETADAIELDAPASRDDGGGSRFLDQHGAFDDFARWQPIPIQDRHLLRATAEDDAARPAPRRIERAPTRIEPRQAGLVGKTPGGEAVADDFHGTAGGGTVTRRIDLSKGAFDLANAAGIAGDGDRELEGLAGIAHVEAWGETLALAHKTVGGEFGGCVAFEFPEHCRNFAERGLAGLRHARQHKVAPHVGDQ